MRHALVLCLLPAIFVCCYGEFKFPDPLIEIFEPKGFKVSIPDVPGATLFAVHINFNEEMEGLEAGHIAMDIIKKKNGRWTYFNKVKTLRDGDKLYYWLYVIVDGLGYRLDDQEYVVKGHSQSPGSGSNLPPPPTPPTKVPNECHPSQSRLGGEPACQGVLFHDDFTNGLSKWSHEVRFAKTPEEEFTIWTKDFETSGISNGNFFIKPKLLANVCNNSFIDSGTLELKGCTSTVQKNCKRSAYSWSILPPVVSSKITTKNFFSFLYGEVEIRAKLPEGDWIVPEIWLEPKEIFYGEQSGRLFLGMARGNPDLTNRGGHHIGVNLLEQGYSLSPSRAKSFKKPLGSSWSSDFHVFKLRWVPESITFFVDDVEMGRVVPPSGASVLNPDLESASKIAPFDREFYISLGVHVGGRSDFPDGSKSNGKTKPWRNENLKNTLDFWLSKDKWYPTWREPNHQLLVDYVKVSSV